MFKNLKQRAISILTHNLVFLRENSCIHLTKYTQAQPFFTHHLDFPLKNALFVWKVYFCLRKWYSSMKFDFFLDFFESPKGFWLNFVYVFENRIIYV